MRSANMFREDESFTIWILAFQIAEEMAKEQLGGTGRTGARKTRQSNLVCSGTWRQLDGLDAPYFSSICMYIVIQESRQSLLSFIGMA